MSKHNTPDGILPPEKNVRNNTPIQVYQFTKGIDCRLAVDLKLSEIVSGHTVTSITRQFAMLSWS